MTGLTPRSHGLRANRGEALPQVTTLAQAFADHGYHTSAVGKLHVSPQRDRIGFHETRLDEEGRGTEGFGQDDYELFLADNGQAGKRFAGGMCNNEYVHRAWHLEERLHPTNWAAQEAARNIKRKDPSRPAFWYLSFSHPHPPLHPLRDYLDYYRDCAIPDPYMGDWAREENDPPSWVRFFQKFHHDWNLQETRQIRAAFYALCTHIDHQIRFMIGTLREQGLLQDTIIAFSSDHGEMLGNHGMWGKGPMLEDSNNVPLIIVGTQQQGEEEPVGHHRVDDRLVGWVDLMPTLLSFAGLSVPPHCEGLDAFSEARRASIYSEIGDDTSRMLRDARYKLIYYPEGNRLQLFDMLKDPRELRNLIDEEDCREHRERLEGILIRELLGCEGDAKWIERGKLVGLPDRGFSASEPRRGLHGQRGDHFPPPKPQGPVTW